MLVCCDIDGVICDPLTEVAKYLIPEKPDWETYFSCTLDFRPIYPGVKLVQAFRADGNNVILVTGRPESNRILTHRWLRMWVGTFLDKELIMRPNDELRLSYEFKREVFLKLKPSLIIDDEPATIKAAEDIGIPALRMYGYRLDDTINDKLPTNSE